MVYAIEAFHALVQGVLFKLTKTTHDSPPRQLMLGATVRNQVSVSVGLTTRETPVKLVSY